MDRLPSPRKDYCPDCRIVHESERTAAVLRRYGWHIICFYSHFSVALDFEYDGPCSHMLIPCAGGLQSSMDDERYRQPMMFKMFAAMERHNVRLRRGLALLESEKLDLKCEVGLFLRRSASPDLLYPSLFFKTARS